MKQRGRFNYVPGSNKNYEPIWYDADYDVKPISAYTDIEYRTHEQFAWIPTRSDFGSLIWMKACIIVEHYMTVNGTHQQLKQTKYTASEYVEAKLKGEIEVGRRL